MVDGRMQFGEEETDAATPVLTAAVADDGATEGPNTDFGTAEDWTRLFTQPGQDEPEATADDAGEEQAKLLLLIDAANGFNNLSRLAMSWTVRHRWSKMVRFVFNAYRHQHRLYV